jgi:hypothetical protein
MLAFVSRKRFKVKANSLSMPLSTSAVMRSSLQSFMEAAETLVCCPASQD